MNRPINLKPPVTEETIIAAEPPDLPSVLNVLDELATNWLPEDALAAKKDLAEHEEKTRLCCEEWNEAERQANVAQADFSSIQQHERAMSAPGASRIWIGQLTYKSSEAASAAFAKFKTQANALGEKFQRMTGEQMDAKRAEIDRIETLRHWIDLRMSSKRALQSPAYVAPRAQYPV